VQLPRVLQIFVRIHETVFTMYQKFIYLIYSLGPYTLVPMQEIYKF